MEIKRGFALFYFFMLVSGLLICFSSSVSATAPNAPTDPLPSHGGYWDYFIQNKTLSCNVTDPDGGTLNVTFYVGSTAVGTNTLVANNTRTYRAMGFTPTNYTTYYWHVRVNDGVTNITGPTWVFKGAAKDPDIIQDGVTDDLDITNLTAEAGWSGTPGMNRADINNEGHVNAFDFSALAGALTTIYSYSLYPPTSASVTAVNTTTVNISWVKGTGTTVDKTIVRSSSINFSDNPGTGFYGWTFTNGTEIYNGTGTYYVDTVTQGSTTYYALWTYNVTEHAYYLPYLSGVIRSITTGYAVPSSPTGVSAVGSIVVGGTTTAINVSWTKGVGLTSATHTLVYFDTINHSVWTRANGTLFYNGTGTYTNFIGPAYNTTRYFALFSYNSTLHSYSTLAVLLNETTQPCPVDTVASFIAAKINESVIRITWAATTGADTIYIRYNFDSSIVPWTRTGGVFCDNQTTGNITFDFTGLNNNRMYWFCAWGYNATYNVYSVASVQSSAKTDANPKDSLTVGTDYKDLYLLDDDIWADYIFPHGWRADISSLVGAWWSIRPTEWKNAQSKTLTDMRNSARAYLSNDQTLPYSWWLYYINGHKMSKSGGGKWDEWTDRVGDYAWHVFKESAPANVQFEYGINISGGITGIGIYIFNRAGQGNNLNGFNGATRWGYKQNVNVPDSGWPWSGTHKYSAPAFSDPEFDYTMYPTPPGLHFGDAGLLTKTSPSRIHLLVNNNEMPFGVVAQDGFDNQYLQHQFIYFDLKDNPLSLDNEKVLFNLLIDGKVTGSYYNAFYTEKDDVDGDGDTSFYFSTGADANIAWRSDTISGNPDINRDICYFFTYNPNIHNPIPFPPSPTPGHIYNDTIIISPMSVGRFETTNIIYFVNDTAFITNVSVFAPSNGTVPVFTKRNEMYNGNLFYTPIESGIYTVKLIRNGNVTKIEQFNSEPQTPHGYIYAAENPVYTNQIFSLKVYYDIKDFPANAQIVDEAGTVLSQWSIPNNRTYDNYTFSTQLKTEGKYYLKLYQLRSYDEQLVTQNILYVKDKEYISSITLSNLQPAVGSNVSIKVTSNIVGVSNMALNYYIINQGNRKFKVDPVGTGFNSVVNWIPTSPVGLWSIQLEFYEIGMPRFYLANATANVVTATIPPPRPPPAPSVNIPSLISMAGPALGITDEMFRVIVGVLIVLLVMLLPLIIAWKAQLKYADRIITNPMVYSVTAIVGSLISWALGLFPLWVFVLIFIVALTFLIRSWRGQGMSSAGE